jgi:hypothetical protein
MLIEMARRVYAGPVEWALRDCCTCPCDVWVALGWGDPMAPLRGRYSSRTGAVRLIASLGGWEAMVADLARHAGLRPGVGAAGEIGLVRAPECTGTGYALALNLGPRRWAVKAGQGYKTVPEAVQQWAN